MCTHKLPNKLQIIENTHKFAFDSEDVWKIKLMDKNQVEAILCVDGVTCQTEHLTGTWSTIYDQSMKIELENGYRFLANFKYTIKDDISKNPLKDGSDRFETVKTGDYGKFDSQCDKTMVGFMQSIPTQTKKKFSISQHNVVCFYGEQETHYEMEKTVSVKTESDTVKVAVITQQNKISTKPIEQTEVQTTKLAQVRSKSTSKRRFNAHQEHKPSNETDLAISFINSQDFGWKADVCKLQKHHADYGSHCEAQEKVHQLAQTESSADLDAEEGKKANSFGQKDDKNF